MNKFTGDARYKDEDDIVVYIVPKQGEYLHKEGLKKRIAFEMPRFMWPKNIRFADELPETPTHKEEKYKLKQAILGELEKNKENQ